MNPTFLCADCVSGFDAVDRRSFLQRTAAISAAALAGTALPARAQTKPASPAEDLVRELFAGLSDAQKRQVVLPWDHGADSGLPTRQRISNRARGQRISEVYTRPQTELVSRILRALCSDDEGYRKIENVIQNDNWNNSGIAGAGAEIFGDPTGDRPFAWVFTAHHLTLRCDGNSQPDAAFGGPLYYGRLQSGNNERNVFHFQTRGVRSIYDALSTEQRGRAVVRGTPGEGHRSIEFRAANQPRPGLGVADLSADQRRLVEQVMTDILAPFRREDATEVMDLIRRNGGLERIHLAFYQEPSSNDQERWHFWRLEGPGFVWNYRILPHVHAYVNVARQA